MFPVAFVVGAAVGATSTYVYKDEPAKQWVQDTSKKLKEAAVSFMDSMKKKPEEPAEASVEAAATAQTVEGTVVVDKMEEATKS
ncbi:hypothetical protein [Thiothrix fructosivorans]|jgi:mitochondrial fission protein ELM1|uniref:Uncharacterized protein n=1 Tax=Thiothrix fructosivorans TaxID=111770 RepID=A0A8B0SHT7_9GAMM|nr:hypothetical protein [Thiothrix fructosivorans]MBO0615235.1 hypothetical protein [Thiothrix fructosivorans]QTX10020.1 hypothetical protein J1836_015645 [Thiothrix fructosivorans]